MNVRNVFVLQNIVSNTRRHNFRNHLKQCFALRNSIIVDYDCIHVKFRNWRILFTKRDILLYLIPERKHFFHQRTAFDCINKVNGILIRENINVSPHHTFEKKFQHRNEFHFSEISFNWTYYGYPTEDTTQISSCICSVCAFSNNMNRFYFVSS